MHFIIIHHLSFLIKTNTLTSYGFVFETYGLNNDPSASLHCLSAGYSSPGNRPFR